MHHVKTICVLALLSAVSSAHAATESIPVKGSLNIRFEAWDGTVGSPEEIKLRMINPPMGLQILELRSELSPLYFSADCRSRQVRVHDEESLVDTGRVFVRNQGFEFSLIHPSIRIAKDGQGHRNCSANVILRIRGRLDCHNPQIPGIGAEIAYQLLDDDRSRGPSTSCSFPRDTYLYGRI